MDVGINSYNCAWRVGGLVRGGKTYRTTNTKQLQKKSYIIIILVNFLNINVCIILRSYLVHIYREGKRERGGLNGLETTRSILQVDNEKL